MKVERIDHIHVVVKDLEKAAKFFSDLMGTKFFGPIDAGKGFNFNVAFDDLGFELMQPKAPGNSVAKRLEEHGEGVAWIGLKVSNLDEAVTELRNKGVSIEYWRDYSDPAKRGDVMAARTTDPKQTYGVMLELVEYQDVLPVLMANYNRIGDIPQI